jgi:3-hydroxyisobutyrate dehydrogenase-like beta-hydroxyacid dehydrogenase
MAVKSVGILSPGDMGHTTGETLRKHGLRVLTCLKGRSARTRALAAEAGFEDTPDLETLVRESDILLCILVPSEALEVARSVAAAVRATGADLLYVDCNAVSPGTTREIGRVITASGARYADGGIIGPPPARPGTTRFYTSGDGAEEFAQLSQYGLDVRVLPGEAGQASGIKMCFAALTKGLQALGIELLIAAKTMGLEEELKAEQSGSMAGVIKWLQGASPRMPPKAYRWVGEMEEIAATFEQLGLTPRILLGAADMYSFIADTPLGKETPEESDKDRDLYEVVAGLAEALEARTAARA